MPAGSSTWVNLTDGSGFLGTNAASLLASAGAAQTGDQFRVVVTNSAGATRSNPVSLTLAAAPNAISVAGFTAPTVAPMSLITVNATGLTPTAVTFVEFVNASGAVVAQISPVAVTATNLTVAVPPLLGSDGASFVAGVLSARIGQFVGGGTVTSNTFTAAQVQAPAVSKSQPGAMTLALLQAELEQANSLLAALPGSTLDAATPRAVVNSTIQSLQGWITNLQRAISGGTSTFALGTGAGTPITLTQRDLQAVDNLLVAALQTLSGGATTATSQAADDGRKRAAAAGNAFQGASGSFAQAGVSGGNDAALASGAKQFMVSLPEATNDVLVQLDGVLGYVVASELATTQLVAGAPILAAGNVALGVGALGYAWLNSLVGLTNASAFILRNTWPETAVKGAIDRRNALLDAVAARGNPSAVATAVLSELNGPAARGFTDLLSRPTDSTGDFLYLARDRRHGATGAVTVAPSGAIYSKAEVSVDRWQIPPKDPADPTAAFDVVRNPYYYSLAIPFSVSVAPMGSSVFTGWRIFAPFFNPYRSFDAQNPNGSYQSAGRDASISLQMVRGGYYVIATFDLAHTLTLGDDGNGTVKPDHEPLRYLAADGVMTPPSYLRGDKVTLTATAKPGYAFSKWSGNYSGSDNPTVIEMTGNKSVTATFTGAPQPKPPAPTNLTATAGTQQVSLGWIASSGATSYNVKFAIASGGPYQAVATVTSPGYTHLGLASGITHYYVVTAVNSGGESDNSNQASATPAAGGGTNDIHSAAYIGYFNISFTGTYTRFGSSTSVTDAYWILQKGDGTLSASLDDNIGALTTSGDITWELTRGSPSWLPSWAGIQWRGKLAVAGADAHASGSGTCEGTASNGATVKGTWTAKWSSPYP